MPNMVNTVPDPNKARPIRRSPFFIMLGKFGIDGEEDRYNRTMKDKRSSVSHVSIALSDSSDSLGSPCQNLGSLGRRSHRHIDRHLGKTSLDRHFRTDQMNTECLYHKDHRTDPSLRVHHHDSNRCLLELGMPLMRTNGRHFPRRNSGNRYFSRAPLSEHETRALLTSSEGG